MLHDGVTACDELESHNKMQKFDDDEHVRTCGAVLKHQRVEITHAECSFSKVICFKKHHASAGVNLTFD